MRSCASWRASRDDRATGNGQSGRISSHPKGDPACGYENSQPRSTGGRSKDAAASTFKLAHNLTIAARGVWSDEQLKTTEMVERLKALNELMHRVFGQAGDETWPADQFVGEYLAAFSEEQREFAGDLDSAVRFAYESVATRPAE